MRATPRTLALVTVALLALTACGDPETRAPDGPVATDPGTPGSSAGDATTTVPGAFDAAAARRRAASLLGAAEADLPGDVRIARRGAEEYGLTDDLVPGRLTVELDDDGTGTFVVVEVAVELEDGTRAVSADTLLEDATSILGLPETGVDPAWRIGRRGEETFALTEDFVVGRFTVELDDDGTGVYVVVAVTVELPGGARTVTG